MHIGIVVLGGYVFWDNKKEEEQLAQISRDETLSRLPLRLSTNRIVELVQLRDTARPVILAGDKETVTRAIQKAERFRSELFKTWCFTDSCYLGYLPMGNGAKERLWTSFKGCYYSSVNWRRF
ncbi:hypothetical protein HPP92_016938 [Vanilla planifolia]|uniref:Uncharacterized protein n=1 Tax=Vanilla planifolia TaxID=51239 RepID=A0A835QKA9_VANPL|nr:hypothetical protein HPP92_016938 [Vanilla planifolia]